VEIHSDTINKGRQLEGGCIVCYSCMLPVFCEVVSGSGLLDVQFLGIEGDPIGGFCNAHPKCFKCKRSEDRYSMRVGPPIERKEDGRRKGGEYLQGRVVCRGV
jgi:hypothetical protein